MTSAVVWFGVITSLLTQSGRLWIPAASLPGSAGVVSALNGSEVRHNAAPVSEPLY